MAKVCSFSYVKQCANLLTAKETKPKGKVPDMFTKKPAAPAPAPAASTSKAKEASISEDDKSEASADSNAEEDSSENSDEDDEVASHQ